MGFTRNENHELEVNGLKITFGCRYHGTVDRSRLLLVVGIRHCTYAQFYIQRTTVRHVYPYGSNERSAAAVSDADGAHRPKSAKVPLYRRCNRLLILIPWML